ncbi:hypothetical protein SUGI_0014650 [Cryptomeria japonica]|nr:hypothetical protein SUGI_0014650 [Cryptomeria japonica]
MGIITSQFSSQYLLRSLLILKNKENKNNHYHTFQIRVSSATEISFHSIRIQMHADYSDSGFPGGCGDGCGVEV